MDAPQPPVRDRTASRVHARWAWTIGGALLLSSAVAGAIIQPMIPYIPGLGYLGTVAFSASLLIFAFGVRGVGSITARRPLGTAAMIGLAVWALVRPTLSDIVYSGFDLGTPQLTFGYVDVLLQLILAVIAVTQIARADVVPAPWNWAPTWCLAAIALAFLLLQGAAFDASQDAALAMAAVTLDSATRAGAAILLGVLAIVLANRSVPPQTVSVFRSSDAN